MGIDAGKLVSEKRFEVWIIAFNATGKTLDVIGLNGAIEYREVKTNDVGTLGPPTIIRDRSRTKEINDGSEFMIVLEQKIPGPIADRMNALLEEYSQIQFGLRQLNVTVGVNGEAAIRLSIWAGLTLDKAKGELKSRQIIEMQAHGRI